MKENDVPLVVTHNPNFKDVSFLICKNLQFLYADPEKIVFRSAPFVPFWHLLYHSEVLET